MVWIKAWLAGFLATLVFHQAVIGAFWLLGAVPAPPFPLEPVPPLGAPKVLSLAFWGVSGACQPGCSSGAPLALHTGRGPCCLAPLARRQLPCWWSFR